MAQASICYSVRCMVLVGSGHVLLEGATCERSCSRGEGLYTLLVLAPILNQKFVVSSMRAASDTTVIGHYGRWATAKAYGKEQSCVL